MTPDARPGMTYKGKPKPGIDSWPIRLGADLFNMRSMTGQNRAPILDLVGFILAGLDDDFAHFIDPDMLAKVILRDGSFVIVNPERPEESRFMDDVYCPSVKKIIRYKRDAETGAVNIRLHGNDMTRVVTDSHFEYTLGNDGWLLEDVSRNNGEIERKVVEEIDGIAIENPVPADTFYVFPNDRGIIYYAQDILNLLEDNRKTTLNSLRGVNLLPMLIGETNVDSTAFEDATNAVIIPGNVTVSRPVSTDSMNALASESNQARSDLYDAYNVVEKDAPQRPSGRDREIRMQSMLQFVRKVRRQIVNIYDHFNTPIKFDELIVRGADERLKELELSISVAAEIIKNGGEIDANKYVKRLNKLI